MASKRSHRHRLTGQRRDPKTGRWLNKPNAKRASVPLEANATLMEHLAVHCDLKRIAKKIATAAYRGDWDAMKLLLKAAEIHKRPEQDEKPDLDKLTPEELRMLYTIQKKLQGV
jgi:hypothetical protein